MRIVQVAPADPADLADSADPHPSAPVCLSDLRVAGATGGRSSCAGRLQSGDIRGSCRTNNGRGGGEIAGLGVSEAAQRQPRCLARQIANRRPTPSYGVRAWPTSGSGGVQELARQCRGLTSPETTPRWLSGPDRRGNGGNVIADADVSRAVDTEGLAVVGGGVVVELGIGVEVEIEVEVEVAFVAAAAVASNFHPQTAGAACASAANGKTGSDRQRAGSLPAVRVAAAGVASDGSQRQSAEEEGSIRGCGCGGVADCGNMGTRDAAAVRGNLGLAPALSQSRLGAL